MGLKFRPTPRSSTNALSNLRIIPVSRYLVIRSRRDFLQTYPFLAKKRIENLKTELGNVHIRRPSLFLLFQFKRSTVESPILFFLKNIFIHRLKVLPL